MKVSNLQRRFPTGDEDCKVFRTLVAHLNVSFGIWLVTKCINCLDLLGDSDYLVIGQVELLYLLVGDALGENVDALVREQVVREVEQTQVDKLVHP